MIRAVATKRKPLKRGPKPDPLAFKRLHAVKINEPIERALNRHGHTGDAEASIMRGIVIQYLLDHRDITLADLPERERRKRGRR
jgi:hypothetical protein